MNRFTALGFAAVLCVGVSACAGDPGDEMAQAACRGYVATPPDRATVDERTQRAGEANESYAALQGDIDDAWSLMDAMTAAHNGGQQISGDQLDAYAKADDQVRADCAAAGEDLGPRQP